MKTPRQILFQKHQSAEALLDEIRHEVLCERKPLTANIEVAFSVRDVIASVGRTLRWHLAGLGLAWAVIMAFTLGGSPATVSSGSSAQVSPSAISESWKEHRRQLANFETLPVLAGADQPLPNLAVPDRRRRSQLTSVTDLA